MGQAITMKSCNTQACSNDIGSAGKQQKLLAPIIRVVAVSNRLQRYELCVVKEGDMMLQMDKEVNQKYVELPVRVILNNRTLTIFSQSKYNNVYKSFDLPFLNIEMDGRKDYQKRCFVLTDKRTEKKKEVLCIMAEALRKGENTEGAKN